MTRLRVSITQFGEADPSLIIRRYGASVDIKDIHDAIDLGGIFGETVMGIQFGVEALNALPEVDEYNRYPDIDLKESRSSNE